MYHACKVPGLAISTPSLSMAKQTTLFGDLIEQPALKRRRSGSYESDSNEDPRKKREIFKEAWKEKAPWPRLHGVDLPDRVMGTLPSTWLEYKVDDGMYCMLCTKWNKVPRRGTPTWTSEPCILLRSESVIRHSETQMHRSAAKEELDSQLASIDGGIAAAFENVWEAEECAMKAALACVYFLAKEEIPHTTKYEPSMKLLLYLGLPHLEVLNKGGNAKYTSYRIVDELLTLLGDEVKQKIGRSLQESPCIGLICDETTDISSTKALVVYAKAVVHCSVQTYLIALKELSSGEADAPTICSLLLETVADYGLEIECVAAFGSDGASVMTGKHTGVAARLKQMQPSLVSIHCVAHRLVLAVTEAADQVSPIKQFKSYLNSFFTYFHRSPKRAGKLQASFERLFDQPALKLRQPSDTRWLACDEAVQTLKRSLEPLTKALEDIANSDDGDATAVGLAGILRRYKFVSCVFLWQKCYQSLQGFQKFSKPKIYLSPP